MSPEVLAGLAQASGLLTLLATCIGVLLGLIVGMIPGLTISTGIIVMLPVTFALPPDIYLIDALPIRMHLADFVSVALGSMAICIIATVYPAWKAAHLVPVEAIRYE